MRDFIVAFSSETIGRFCALWQGAYRPDLSADTHTLPGRLRIGSEGLLRWVRMGVTEVE